MISTIITVISLMAKKPYLERHVGGDENVNADVELPASDEERVVDVPLNHVRLGSFLWRLRLVVLTLIFSLLMDARIGNERKRYDL